MMSLTCTCKITAFYLGVPILAQWINVIMNAIIVYGCYKLGKKAGAPLAQSVICVVAMLGYIMYMGILIVAPNLQHNPTLSLLVYSFFVLTLIASITCLAAIYTKKK